MCLIVHRITAISALRNISTLDSSCISCSTRISTLDSSSCFSVTRQCSDCFVLCVWMCCIVFCCLWSSCYTLNTYCKYIIKKSNLYYYPYSMLHSWMEGWIWFNGRLNNLDVLQMFLHRVGNGSKWKKRNVSYEVIMR